jgi:diguanylate cyclase (GGDEF)-like protein/PAS domain S-box-containing protein
VTERGSLLVVDDNEWNRDALSRRLRQKGYNVSIAADGLEAIALAETTAFDLVLLDVEMPGLSGFEVLERLRRTHSQTELPIIMVTARSLGTDMVEAFHLGANDYVTKPVDFDVALARIGTHLSHKWAVERLSDSEERYALAVQGANDGLWDWNLATGEVYWSERWKSMLGHEKDTIGSDPEEWFSRVHPDDLPRVRKELADHLANGAGHYESEHRMVHRDGTFRWVLCRGAAVRNSSGTATRLAGSLTDITGTKVADGLTGLPNRVLFVDLVERAIRRTRRRKEYQFALLVLGLNRFKSVNHSFGLLSADRLLVDVAARLQGSLRSTDCLAGAAHGFTLARLGGDEFRVLVDDIAHGSDAVRVAERLRAALEKPFDVAGQQVFTSATVGIAVSTTGYDRAEDILRDAAIALHRAKAGGTAPYELFDAGMRQRAVSRLQVETDLRHAVESGAFEVHYQPIVAIGTRTIAGFEALVRWRHPTRGLVAPTEFIPVAEDTGMILQIGRLVLTEACRQMADWQRRFGRTAPGVICVNVSNRQFADAGLSGQIESILDQTGLDPASLELEITESAFLGDLAAAQVTLNRGRALGIAWSLDDFGTGYSSLSHLHRLKVGTVKVDRAFVSRLGIEEGGTEMVRAIVALAHSLAMDVVAEGVETVEQLEHLHRLGCEYAQGYYFAEPLDGAAATAFIASDVWRRPPAIHPDEESDSLVTIHE